MKLKKYLTLLTITALAISSSMHPDEEIPIDPRSGAVMRPENPPARPTGFVIDANELRPALDHDDLTAFKKYIMKFFPPSLLREAVKRKATKIVDFLINNNLVDLDKDPLTLTWFALWRPAQLNRLIASQTVSNNLLNVFSKALTALKNNVFQAEPNEIQQAQKLLSDAQQLLSDQLTAMNNH